MIDPKMGSLSIIQASVSIADALFPRVRQRVLALLFGNPDRSFFSNEVVALVQSGTGAVQRELASLAQAGLLTVTSQGNQKHYRANEAAPVFEELRGLVLKTSGLVDVLRSFLAPLASQIDAAFVYGSVAKRQDTAASDVDLMVIAGSVGYADLFTLMEEAGARLGRKVNPRLDMTVEKLWVIGSAETLHGVPA